MGGLCSVGSGSPSEDWGEMVQKQVFRFSVPPLQIS